VGLRLDAAVIRSIAPPLIMLSRPLNCLGVGILALASSLLAMGRSSHPTSVPLTVAGSMLVAAGGYALNDVFDHATDRLAHPDRALPAGLIARPAARTYALTLLVTAPILFLPINKAALASASVAAMLLFLYSWKVKRSSGLLGNLVIATLAANNAMIGGFAQDNLLATVPWSACIFMATLSREIVKDVEDLTGDSTTRVGSLPMLIGASSSCRVAGLLLLLAVPVTYLSRYPGPFAPFYVVGASLINILVLWTATRLTLGTPAIAGRVQRWTKAAMYLYIFLFLLIGLSRGIDLGGQL